MCDDVEAARLAKLASFDILDTPYEREYETLTWLAQRLLGCPITAISLVDDHRQWFKSHRGIEHSETSRDISFCAHALPEEQIMIVEDANSDARFADNPFVTDGAIRFYAGVPLRPHSPGHDDDLPGIGTLCIADSKPRTLTPEQIEILRDLAQMVSTLIQARSSANAAIKLARLAEDRAKEVERKNRQLAQAERLAAIGSWRLDLETETLEWSDHVFAIHALPVGTPPSVQDALNYYPPQDHAYVADCLKQSADSHEPFDFECDLLRADSVLRRVRCIGEPEVVDGTCVALIGVFQDVTEQHVRVEHLRRTASTDSLTGLPNRAAFEQRFGEAMTTAQKEGAPLSLLLLDLDGFKAVNDNLGHDAGDDVLRTVADRLRATGLSRSFAARLGGDEFVMLVSRPRDCAALEKVVAKVIGDLTCSVTRADDCRTVSVTIGAARWEPGQAALDLMRQADLALYQAKRHKRGTGRIFGDDTVITA